MKGRYRKADGARQAPEGRCPDPPDEMTEAAKAEWRRIVPMLWEKRVTESLDVDVLRTYCQTIAMIWECDRLLTEQGMVIEGPRGGLTPNPVVRNRVQLVESMRKLAIELGMTPLSRGRVQPAPEAPESDTYEELLDG